MIRAKATLILALAGGAFLLSVPPAAANHDLCPGNTHQMSSGTTGTVWSGNDDHWLLVVTSVSVIVELVPSGGDADLYIFEPTCTLSLDSAAGGGTAVDRASIPVGVWEVRVHYFSGPATIPYTLFVY